MAAKGHRVLRLRTGDRRQETLIVRKVEDDGEGENTLNIAPSRRRIGFSGANVT